MKEKNKTLGGKDGKAQTYVKRKMNLTASTLKRPVLDTREKKERMCGNGGEPESGRWNPCVEKKGGEKITYLGKSPKDGPGKGGENHIGGGKG